MVKIKGSFAVQESCCFAVEVVPLFDILSDKGKVMLTILRDTKL